MRTLETQMPTLSLPTAKYRQFMLEARALDAKEMRDYTLQQTVRSGQDLDLQSTRTGAG